jgi:hypothetical protein
VRVQLVLPWRHQLNTHFSDTHQPPCMFGMSGVPTA